MKHDHVARASIAIDAPRSCVWDALVNADVIRRMNGRILRGVVPVAAVMVSQ